MENQTIQTPTQSQIQTIPVSSPVAPQETSPIAPKKKSKVLIIIILIVFFLLTLAYFIYQKSLDKKQPLSKTKPSAFPQVPQDSSLPSPSSDWKKYENKEYGYSLEYPVNWQVTQDITNQIVIYEGTEPHLPSPYPFGQIIISNFAATSENNLETWFDKFFYSEDSPADPDTLSQLSNEGIITSQNGLQVLKTTLPSTYLYFFIAYDEVLTLSANLTKDTEKNKKLDQIYTQAINSLQLTFQSVEIIGDQCSPKETYKANELSKYPECEANINCYWKSLENQIPGTYACCPKKLKNYPKTKVYNGVKIEINMEDIETLLRCLIPEE